MEGKLLLDPTAPEAAREEAGLLVAMMPSINEVAALVSRGAWASSAELQDAIELCMGGCSQLDETMRETLLAAATQRLSLQDA